MKKLFFVLVCVFAIMTTSCGGGASTPSDAATECIELIKAKDYEGFVDKLHMSKDATAEEVEQLKQMYVSLFKEKVDKQTEKKGGFASYTILSEEIAEDGQSAKVKYEITYGNGSTEKNSLDFVLVDGEWKPAVNK